MGTPEKTQKTESSVSYLNEIILEIFQTILSHLDLKSIGSLRIASKKLKEKADKIIPSYVNSAAVDKLFTKENISQMLHDFYCSRPGYSFYWPLGQTISDEELNKIVTLAPSFTRNLSTYAMLRQFPETRKEVPSHDLGDTLRKKFEEKPSSIAILKIIVNRIIFYMENYFFSSQEELLLFKELLPEFVKVLISCSSGGNEKVEDVLPFIENKLFCFILNVFHREIKKYKKDTFTQFLVTFRVFVTQSFHLQFLQGILTPMQVHGFLKKYQFEKAGSAVAFYNSLLGMAETTANDLNFEMLQITANFYKAYESSAIAKIRIYMEYFCSYLIPAIIQYYYADHAIVSVEQAASVFEGMGLTQLNLENLPRLILFSECTKILYEEKIFGVSPDKQSSVMFHFLWDFLVRCDLSKDTDWLHNAVHAMTIVLKGKKTRVSEIKFLFRMAKIYKDVDDIARSLVLVENSKHAFITAEAVQSWAEQFPVLMSKEVRPMKRYLVYLFTEAILALSNMQLLDEKGKVIEQLKSLTFTKNRPPRENILFHLSICFEEQISLAEIGKYFLETNVNQLINDDVRLMRLVCFLIKNDVIPRIINFSDFWELFSCLKDTFYFEITLKNMVNFRNFKLVNKDFFYTLESFLQKSPEYIAESGKNDSLNCCLGIYLLNLSIKKPVSLESIFSAFNSHGSLSYKLLDFFIMIADLYENKRLSLEMAQGLSGYILNQQEDTYLVRFERFLKELSNISALGFMSNAIVNIFIQNNFNTQLCLKLIFIFKIDPEQCGKWVRQLLEDKYDEHLGAKLDECYKQLYSKPEEKKFSAGDEDKSREDPSSTSAGMAP